MSASHGPFLVLALSLLMACREAPGRHDHIAERDTSGPLAAEPPQIVVAAAGPPERDPLESAPTETRSAPLDISGERLEAAWPTLLGKRVRLTAKIERAVDTTRVLVRASGRVFLVNLSPKRIWSGTATLNFVVLGQALVAIHGKTMMVELMLDEDVP